MKKLIAGVMALALLASCGNKKTGIDPFASLTNEVDSALHRADTLHRPKAPEEPKPTEADESFDDFITLKTFVFEIILTTLQVYF